MQAAATRALRAAEVWRAPPAAPLRRRPRTEEASRSFWKGKAVEPRCCAVRPSRPPHWCRRDLVVEAGGDKRASHLSHATRLQTSAALSRSSEDFLLRFRQKARKLPRCSRLRPGSNKYDVARRKLEKGCRELWKLWNFYRMKRSLTFGARCRLRPSFTEDFGERFRCRAAPRPRLCLATTGTSSPGLARLVY